MASGYINKERKIFADDVNNPHIMNAGGITDTVAEHIADIIDDNAEEVFFKENTVNEIVNAVLPHIPTPAGGITYELLATKAGTGNKTVTYDLPKTNPNNYKSLMVILTGGNATPHPILNIPLLNNLGLAQFTLGGLYYGHCYNTNNTLVELRANVDGSGATNYNISATVSCTDNLQYGILAIIGVK